MAFGKRLIMGVAWGERMGEAKRKSAKSRVMENTQEMVEDFVVFEKRVGCISAAKLKGIGKIPRFILFA